MAVSDTTAKMASVDTDQVDSEKIQDIQVEIATQHLVEIDFTLLSHESIQFKSRASLRLAGILLVQGLALASFGVDYGVISGVVAMPQFQAYFDLQTSGSKYGLIVAAVYIGNGVASLFLWLSDYIGRRGVSFIGCVITVIGGIIQVANPSPTSLLVGRLFTGAGGALTATVAPLYMNEISPACWRGFLVGANAACSTVGTITIGIIVIGCSFIVGNWSWRFPILFQVVLPFLAAVLIYPVTPESPRYLVSKGKVDQARSVIARYHTTAEDINGPLVNASIRQIEDSLKIVDTKPWDFSVLYKKKTDRYRLFLIFLYSMFQQWYGGALFTYYLPAVLTLVGITGTQRQLGLNLGYSLTATLSTVFGAYIFEKFRRRTLLITGMGLFVVLLTLMTICSAIFTSSHQPALGYVIVVWVFLFALVKGTTVVPMHSIYPNECLHYSQRAKGMGMYSFFQALFGVAITYGASAAIAIIGWKIFIVFIVIDLFIMVMTYFFFPEFKGLTLEEIDIVFETPGTSPVALSKKLQQAKVDSLRAHLAGEVSPS